MSADKYDTIDLRRVCIDVLARWMVRTGPWSSYASRTTILKLVCDNLPETSDLHRMLVFHEVHNVKCNSQALLEEWVKIVPAAVVAKKKKSSSGPRQGLF